LRILGYIDSFNKIYQTGTFKFVFSESRLVNYTDLQLIESNAPHGNFTNYVSYINLTFNISFLTYQASHDLFVIADNKKSQPNDELVD